MQTQDSVDSHNSSVGHQDNSVSFSLFWLKENKKKMDTSKYMDKQITKLSQSQSLNFLGDDDKQEVEDGDHGFEFNTVRSLSQSLREDLDETSFTVPFLSFYQ